MAVLGGMQWAGVTLSYRLLTSAGPSINLHRTFIIHTHTHLYAASMWESKSQSRCLKYILSHPLELTLVDWKCLGGQSPIISPNVAIILYRIFIFMYTAVKSNALAELMNRA